ncbi:MAG: hypothetical protein GF355_07840 [Candidatus Eisenbacteria bacterium]|nr:hypothetical protein [Candidatus Eisenbacteria bacterium]
MPAVTVLLMANAGCALSNPSPEPGSPPDEKSEGPPEAESAEAPGAGAPEIEAVEEAESPDDPGQGSLLTPEEADKQKPRFVRLYREGFVPECPFEEVGYVRAREPSVELAEKTLRSQVAQLGGEAAVDVRWMPVESGNAAGVWLLGTAIRYTDPACREDIGWPTEDTLEKE